MEEDWGKNRELCCDIGNPSDIHNAAVGAILRNFWLLYEIILFPKEVTPERNWNDIRDSDFKAHKNKNISHYFLY